MSKQVFNPATFKVNYVKKGVLINQIIYTMVFNT